MQWGKSRSREIHEKDDFGALIDQFIDRNIPTLTELFETSIIKGNAVVDSKRQMFQSNASLEKSIKIVVLSE